ncbi:MAG: hypothetical protein D6794_12285, partial [Deltaproteobacteria bacterium]
MKQLLIAVAALLLLAGCALGPNYQKPDMEVPVRYKTDAPWKEATPAAHLPKGNWWQVYGDEELNRLEEQAAKANQDLKAAYARLSQVLAAAGISRSERLPQVDLNASVQRLRTAGDLTGTGSGLTTSRFSLPLSLGYEIDLWGRVRRTIEAAEADVDAAGADYRSLLLVLQTDLARSYFALRSLDREIDLLDRTVALRAEALRMVKSRFKHGQVGRLDVSRAETELASTRAEAIGLRKSRAELENRIAVLLGQLPSQFSLKPLVKEQVLPS